MIKRVLMPVEAILLLVGCANPSTTEKLTQTANKSLETLSDTLPTECKTENIKKQIQNIHQQIETISIACESEKKQMTTENKYRILVRDTIIGILALVIVFLTKGRSK